MFITLSIALILTIISVYTIHKSNNISKRIVINDIESFNPKKESSEDHYLLFYPADTRTSQKNTLVKEVLPTGEAVKEYEIRDDEFRRMFIHQKPNNINQLYISFFGEAVLENWFYTYDINKRKFKKIDLDYFKFDVGVDHIKHYGTDILFQSIVSHKTGDQNTNEKDQFNMSISDYTTKKSYETEYGHEAGWSPLLQFSDKIIYAGSGQVNDVGYAVNAFVGLIDLKTGKVEYMKFDKESTGYYPVYTTEKNAYIISDQGNLFVLDTDLNYKTYTIFKDLSPQDSYYNEDGSLLLDKEKALYIISNEESDTTLGILSFNDKPSFSVLNKNYINKKMTYRILYQDTMKEEIYLIESDNTDEDNGNIIVIDSKNFDLVNKIPIEDDYLLDFVVKL